MSALQNSASSTLLDGKQVAIVGGGPAGLTLARLLQMRGAQVRVFDLEASTNARNQGGALDLHEVSGQRAMREAGLMDQFLAASRPEGQATKVFDKAGKTFVDMKPEDENATKPEIDRGVLKGLLYAALAPHTVSWNRRLERVERTAAGRPRLVFADGSTFEADLVFGCDGAWSRVRPLVSDSKPHYSGVTFVESRVSAADTHHPKVSELVGDGAIMATSDNKALLAQRNGDGNIRIYVTLRVPESWTKTSGLDFDNPAQVREKLLAQFDGWAPHITEMLRVSDDFFVPRPLYTFPPHQTWTPQPDITLLGDAAHVMPPFTGKGANFAMLDAVELADALTDGRFPDIPVALRAYEAVMLERMVDAITEVITDQDVFISDTAPEGIVALMQRRVANRA
jgi:2-polyprenyl-6-methoxyphenol hydroxylase-like FAD-dependent oxidoreductase